MLFMTDNKARGVLYINKKLENYGQCFPSRTLANQSCWSTGTYKLLFMTAIKLEICCIYQTLT